MALPSGCISRALFGPVSPAVSRVSSSTTTSTPSRLYSIFHTHHIRPRRLQQPRNQQTRTLIKAPSPSDGPLMTRRADRELPELPPHWATGFLKTIPLFLLVVGACTAGFFNYQKTSSPVVESVLFSLRVNEKAKEVLGEEITYASAMPWISGEMNQLHGKIDIHFAVKGKRGTGTVRFRCERPTRMGYFNTLEYSLTLPDGEKLDLLEEHAGHGVVDPTAHAAINVAAV